MATFFKRIKNGWNAFLSRDPTTDIIEVAHSPYMPWASSFARPDRPYHRYSDLREVISNAYNRIAVDAMSIDMKHIRIDSEENYVETIRDSLNDILNIEANIDQTGKEFIGDLIMSMCDEGCVAAIPVDTDVDPSTTDSFKVLTARTGKILQWYPNHIRVEVYNDITGKKEDIVIEKRLCPIFENPFYSTMNETNSVARRLLTVLTQLSKTNATNSSNAIDILIQLPYSSKSQVKKDYAQQRITDLGQQLNGSPFGIGYIDASEKVIQLNRRLENNLWEQAKELTLELYKQLGLTPDILNGTADEATMINYYNRTIEPFLSTIALNMERKWISKTARTQGQTIRYYRDPFKLVPVSQLAEIADKFRRNELMTSNEIRAKIGMKPSTEERANELRNPNLNKDRNELDAESTNTEVTEPT